MMEKTTLAHKSEVKRSNWQPPSHSQVRRHGSQSSCNGCGACRKITRSTNASASLMLKSLDSGKKVCATSFLQRTYGNQYVQRLIQTKKDSPCLERCGSRTIQMKASGCCGGCTNHGKEEEKAAVQTKLTIGRPGDKYEQEADRVADTVMRMQEPQIRRQPEEGEEEIQMKSLSEQITPIIQRQPEEEGEELQAKEGSGKIQQTSDDLHSRLNLSRGGGQPLPKADRNFMERRFGSDFSGVRVHTNSNAVQMSKELNAEAFTAGNNIYFGAGRYNPDISSGKRLLAHELTHVVQQSTKNELIVNRQGKGDDINYRKITLENVASIVNDHILDYESKVYQGTNQFKPPEKEESSLWFLVALGGNLVWAATSLTLSLSAPVIAAMAFGGAIVGSGTLQRLFSGNAKTPDLKTLLLQDLGAYTSTLKGNLDNISKSLYDKFLLLQLDDANNKDHLIPRRKVAWSYMFDERVAPWGQSHKIRRQTTEDIKLIWKDFDNSFGSVVMNVWKTGLRYKGQKLFDKTRKLYIIALITSGVAKRSPAVKKELLMRITGRDKNGIYMEIQGVKVIFPTGAKITIPTGNPLGRHL